ncbi:MAG: M1 family metallopeptidase, partial [bacterium]|nr:M1 family metallopeptidase [bacterium]
MYRSFTKSRRILVFVICVPFLALAFTEPASADIADTPARDVDFLHMRLEITFTESDFDVKRMPGVVTFWVRPKFADATTPGAASIRYLSLNAVGLDIETVEQAGPQPLPDWTGPGEPPVGWPASEVDDVAENLSWRLARFEADGRQLKIELDRACPPHEGFWIRIRYVANNPPLGLHFVPADPDYPDLSAMVYTHA